GRAGGFPRDWRCRGVFAAVRRITSLHQRRLAVLYCLSTGRSIVVSLAAASLVLLTAPVGAAIRFVDPSSPGPLHTGGSWSTAFTTLPAALSAAAVGDEIWVAEGIYKPTTGTDRTISFQVPTGVRLFGGFGGFGTNESSLSQRNILLHKSILSGDIGAARNADNS